MDAIRQLNVRLDRVTVENLEWDRCLSIWDRPSTFFFLDPPYTHCSSTLYSPWTIADIHRLRERLASLRGKWMVTLNDHPEIRAIFQECSIKSVTRPKGIGAKGATYKEIIITPV
jgi:DNA adenine methylase